MTRLLSISALVLAIAVPAMAQSQLTLQMADGKVTLDATAVPVRQILAEWARVGGTKVVGAEKVPGGPVTLKFNGLPERQALDILLRNAAGFMAAPRTASAAPGASTYDRILILATSSSAPATAGNAAARPGATPPPQMGNARRLPPPRPAGMAPPPQPVQADEDEAEDEEMEDDSDTGVDEPVFSFPSPQAGFGQPATGNAPVFVPGQPNPNGPVITLQQGPNGQPTVYTFNPTAVGPDGAPIPPTLQIQEQQQQQNQAPAPGGFGVIGAPTPGMIQLPPPGTPGQPTRPPGQ